MESKLFTWDQWDQHDTMSFSYYDPELQQDIGKYPKGTKFASAFIDYETGDLEFYDGSDTPALTLKLELKVVE